MSQRTAHDGVTTMTSWDKVPVGTRYLVQWVFCYQGRGTQVPGTVGTRYRVQWFPGGGGFTTTWLCPGDTRLTWAAAHTPTSEPCLGCCFAPGGGFILSFFYLCCTWMYLSFFLSVIDICLWFVLFTSSTWMSILPWCFLNSGKRTWVKRLKVWLVSMF